MGTKTQKLSNVVDQIVEWQSVFTGDGSTGLTAVAGRGYFIDTTSGTVTFTLPASPKIGDTVTIADYATTFATNNVTINPNGNKIEASTANGVLSTNDQTHTLVFTDSTQGWKIINQDTASSIQPAFVAATGGTVTTSSDYKIHTFTGDGCFVVSCAGNSLGSTSADYLVVAGGGGGGAACNNGSGGGGGGAGGYRESHSIAVSGPYTASPLATPTGITLSAQTYPITVGAGGTGGPAGYNRGSSGSNSVFSTITSAGGGGGGTKNSCDPAKYSLPGGSGGGGVADSGSTAGANGNTPPVSPPQGNNGGPNGSSDQGGGGGGAGGTGGAGATPAPGSGGLGGVGTTSEITASPVARAGGGGGGNYAPGPNGTGGSGGGGNGGRNTPGANGSANTGGGGGGTGSQGGGAIKAGTGGSGIVIIRYKYQ